MSGKPPLFSSRHFRKFATVLTILIVAGVSGWLLWRERTPAAVQLGRDIWVFRLS
jgi:hypothetical protein